MGRRPRVRGTADGRLLYARKQRWRDGTTHIAFEPLELIEKLAALVPAPRINLVYHGILAPAARHRSRVVPREHPKGPTRQRPPRDPERRGPAAVPDRTPR